MRRGKGGKKDEVLVLLEQLFDIPEYQFDKL